MSPAITTVNKAMAVVFGVLLIASFIAPVVEQLPLKSAGYGPAPGERGDHRIPGFLAGGAATARV